MKLYQAFDVDEVTPAQWLAVHPLRWQEHWGEPAIMFREVDDKTQALADAAPAMRAALKAEEKLHNHIAHCHYCNGLTGECQISLTLGAEARQLRRAALALAEGEEAEDAHNG